MAILRNQQLDPNDYLTDNQKILLQRAQYFDQLNQLAYFPGGIPAPEGAASIIDTDYELGQNNIDGKVGPFGFDIHNPVFLISGLSVVLFVFYTLALPEQSSSVFSWLFGVVTKGFDWFFIGAGDLVVLFCLVLIVSPFGKVRLGGRDATPDYTYVGWFAMLFAAGMGIGLMFWSVAEPVGYYTDWFGTPLNVEPNTPQAKDMALGAVMYHWGLHPWAIYGVVALSLAFFAYNKGMPLTIRSAFYPILGERCWGWAGHVIDVLAVLATIFGLATSLGLGAKQAAGGMHFLFDTPNAINVQIAIIVGVTAAAVISVMRGLDGGVKLLSNINMGLAALLLLFVMIAGPTLLIFTSMGQTAVDYVVNIIPLSNWVGREDQGFLQRVAFPLRLPQPQGLGALDQAPVCVEELQGRAAQRHALRAALRPRRDALLAVRVDGAQALAHLQARRLPAAV